MYFLMITFLFTFSAFSFLQINDVNLSDKILIIAFIYFAVALHIGEFIRFPLNYLLLLIIWVITNFLSAILASNPKLAFVFSLNYLLQLFLFMSFIIVFSYNTAIREKLIKFIYKFSIVVGLIGILESLFSAKMQFFLMLFREKNYMYGRSSSLFENPNHLGVFLVVMFVLGMHFFFTTKNKAYIVGNFIVFLGLLSSGCRAALVALVIGVILLVFWSIKYRIVKMDAKTLILLPTVILLLILGFTMTQLNRIDLIIDSLQGGDLEVASGFRATIWANALIIFTQNLVWGIGSGNFQQEVAAYIGVPRGIHSLYLSLLVETGLVGFFAFLSFILVTWNRAKYILKTGDRVIFKTLLPTLLITQITEMQMYNVVQVIFIFWLILSIPYSDMLKNLRNRQLQNKV